MLIQARVCEKRQEQTSKIPNSVTFEHGPKERRMIFFYKRNEMYGAKQTRAEDQTLKSSPEI